MTPHIQLSSGEFFNFLEPDPSVITVGVIAKALSQLCRFTGHTREFYSVAQHSVLVSYLVPPHLARWGLFHDAAEAFLGDVSSPLKQLVPDYKAIEKRVERVVWESFGLYGDLPPEVKIADTSVLLAERDALLPDVLNIADAWGERYFANVPKCSYVIAPVREPWMAESMFLARARLLAPIRIAA